MIAQANEGEKKRTGGQLANLDDLQFRSITPKAEAVADFNTYSQEFLKSMVWADNCRSWYKNGKESGTVTGTYAGTILHFKDCLESLAGENFDVVWRSKNRFRWLGNGQSKWDKDGMGDLAYYMKRL